MSSPVVVACLNKSAAIHRLRSYLLVTEGVHIIEKYSQKTQNNLLIAKHWLNSESRKA